MFKTEKPPVKHAAKQPARPRVPSIISAEMRVQGNLTSDGDLQVEGAVIGDITVAKLVIAEGGTVAGNIVAQDVKICGCLTGSVRAPLVVLTSTAQVVGDVHHELLTIERGGRLEGFSRRIVVEVVEILAPVPEPHWENGHDHGQHHEHQHHEHH
jgi:cytoskeletal protein CcmA (bactofilin family)